MELFHNKGLPTTLIRGCFCVAGLSKSCWTALWILTGLGVPDGFQMFFLSFFGTPLIYKL